VASELVEVLKEPKSTYAILPYSLSGF